MSLVHACRVVSTYACVRRRGEKRGRGGAQECVPGERSVGRGESPSCGDGGGTAPSCARPFQRRLSALLSPVSLSPSLSVSLRLLSRPLLCLTCNSQKVERRRREDGEALRLRAWSSETRKLQNTSHTTRRLSSSRLSAWRIDLAPPHARRNAFAAEMLACIAPLRLTPLALARPPVRKVKCVTCHCAMTGGHKDGENLLLPYDV